MPWGKIRARGQPPPVGAGVLRQLAAEKNAADAANAADRERWEAAGDMALTAEPFPSQGVFRCEPKYSLGGKGVPRDQFIKHSVNLDAPGPGEGIGDVQPSMGFQPLSTQRSGPSYRIGTGKRPPLTEGGDDCSPGPGAINTFGMGESGPKGSTFKPFVTATRLPMWAAVNPPGPGDYALPPAIGEQVDSRYPTLPISSFERAPLVGMGTEDWTPGVKYAHQHDAFGVHAASRTMPAYSLRARTAFGTMYPDRGAEYALRPGERDKHKMTTSELIGNMQKEEMNKAVAAEMNAFPSTKPRPKHDRRAPRAGGAAAQSWGFHTSGFHRRSDDELENRVKRWSDAARIERVENIQRLDATGAMN